MFWRRQPRAAQIFVGVGAPYAPRSAKRLLHFRSSAAAAQEQRRYYISAPSYRNPTCRPGKEVKKPWFLAHLWLLSVRAESHPPDAGPADSPPNPALKRGVGNTAPLRTLEEVRRLNAAGHTGSALQISTESHAITRKKRPRRKPRTFPHLYKYHFSPRWRLSWRMSVPMNGRIVYSPSMRE